MTSILYTSPAFSLSHDTTHNWLLAEWHGVSDYVSSLASCALLMQHASTCACTKLFCDSTQAVDGWSEIGEWVSTSFFPRLAEAGITVVAWVNAQDWTTSAVIERIVLDSSQPFIATFEEPLHAFDWLLRQPAFPKKQ
jgi:hypothetical protein